MPIIMLTAIDEPTDRIVGLEIGADDYSPSRSAARAAGAGARAIRSAHAAGTSGPAAACRARLRRLGARYRPAAG